MENSFFFSSMVWMVRGGVCTYIGCTMMGHEAFIALLHGWGVVLAKKKFLLKTPLTLGSINFSIFSSI
jgi:hypothetical protein